MKFLTQKVHANNRRTSSESTELALHTHRGVSHAMITIGSVYISHWVLHKHGCIVGM